MDISILLMFLSAKLLCGQAGGNYGLNEKVTLVTDRNLYISGENVKFAALLQTGDNSHQTTNSLVLYCELITPDGEKINGNKFIIENNFASGKLLIPTDISSGIYYLRAYTRFMRNMGPSSYNYSIIKIVNAGRTELQEPLVKNSNSASKYETSRPEDTINMFKIRLDKSSYQRRETVNLTINTVNGHLPFHGLSLSVIPEYTFSNTKITPPESVQDGTDNYYRHERLGPSVTGKLTDSSSGAYVRNARINLSIMGRQKDFMAQLTDSSGRFFFSMPEFYGNHDLYLCTDESNQSKFRILVDNDFCTNPVNILSPTFSLTSGERDIAFQMAVNLQVGSYFRVDSLIKKVPDTFEETSFYGTPSDIIYIDKYVSLPTLEEYFNSLPSLVKVRKHMGKKYFKITGTQTGLSDFDPLVLVDMVAIGNPVKVLAISPGSISRIEVVNSIYVKGDQIYGGIINIVTKKGDFGGIDLPTSGIFINYCFLSERMVPETVLQHLPNRPDTRNTLFWEPKLALNSQNISKISFSTSDTPGKFLIVLSWTDMKGKVNRQISEFEVIR